MSEDWAQLAKESERVFHDRTGMTYEYKEVEILRHSSGRHLERYESLHIDADEPRVSWDWVDNPEERLAQLHAMVAEREASGKQAFFDLNSKGDQPTQAPSAAQPAPGDDELTGALTSLLQRSGGFVSVNEAGGRFVQFAGGVGEPLLLDVPNLSAEEGARASAAFAGQAFSLTGSTFNLAYGQDCAAAAEGARRFFSEVLQIASPVMTIEQG